jgi:hypothetical protein
MQQTNMIFWLVFLLAAAAISYFVLPGLAPQILIGSGVVLLILTAYMHWSKFGVMEYERATWQYNLRQYGSYLMMGAVILGAYGFYAMNQTPSESSIPAVIPTVGGGFGTVMKTASSRIQELMRRGRISTNN